MTIDYKNGKIYTLRTYNDDSLIYIGSTCQQLSKRHYEHKLKYKRYTNGKCHYLTSYEVVKCGNTYIELLEIYPCNTKHQLQAREGYWIRKTKCVNKNISDNNEITNNYRISHRDKLRLRDLDNQ